MKIEFKKAYFGKDELFVVDFLSSHLELSKMKMKKAIGWGGLWVQKKGQKKFLRVKKIKTILKTGDAVRFYYLSSLENIQEQNCFEVYQGKGFGVWYKPAGMNSDSTPISDKWCLSSVVKEKYKNYYLIQRLDFETSGLMLVAYNKQKAAFYSKELKGNRINKFYQAEVLGILEDSGQIQDDLDGKEAHSIYHVKKIEEQTSFCEVELVTGRFHQIRRHMNGIGHPVMGDPKYGEGNKNKTGMKLVAYREEFFDPDQRKRIEVILPQELRLF